MKGRRLGRGLRGPGLGSGPQARGLGFGLELGLGLGPGLGLRYVEWVRVKVCGLGLR